MMAAVRRRLGRWAPLHGVGGRFWTVMDSDAIRIYQTVVYSLVFAGGLVCLNLGIPKALDEALSDDIQWLWVVGAIAGPAITYLGVRWTDRFEGWLIQAAGDVSVGGVFSTYTLGVAQENWGSGMFAPIIFVGLGIWSWIIAARDFRKAYRINQDVMHP